MKDFSYITNSHPAFIESLYNDFVNDPDSVDPEMKKFFEGFDFAVANGQQLTVDSQQSTVNGQLSAENWMSEIRVYRLILGYRNKGHLIAGTNPIRKRKDRNANLDLSFFKLSEEDLDKTFNAGNLLGLGPATLRNILNHLRACYASHGIGIFLTGSGIF